MNGVVSESLAAALADRYELLRELGAGGMATVYLARDVRHGREVAIKVLHPELAAVLGAERFLSEIRTTASLQHPHILPLFDSGEAAGQLFYVMPFVDGETLRTRLEREKQLPIADALLIAREVADALQYAHERGIIHRDIKPENILLQGGHALVADFGIALAVTNAGGARMTQTGLSLGTPQYMAPEQAMGERTIDARADVYALGAVTYEMLAGEPPFTGPTSQAIVAKIMSGEPAPLETLRRNVPASVVDTVHHALEKLPADRFTSAREFASALRGDASIATRPASGRRRENAARGLRARVWPALAIVGIFVSLVLAAALFARRGGSANANAVSALYAIELPDSLVLSVSPGGPKVTVDRAGRQVAVILERPGSVVRWLYLRRTDDRTFRRIEGTNGALFPSFSTDGRQLAYVVDRTVYTVPVEGGRPSPVEAAAGQPLWLDDGRLLIHGDSLWLVAPGRPARRIEPRLDGTLRDVRWTTPLPGSTHAVVAFRSGGKLSDVLDRAELAIMELATGTLTRLNVQGTNPRHSAAGYLLFGRRDGLYAVAFDAQQRQISGEPVRLTDNVAYNQNGMFSYDVSDEGTVMFEPASTRKGELRNALVRVDLSGRVTLLDSSGTSVRGLRISPDGARAVACRDCTTDVNNLWIYEFATGAWTPLTTDSTSSQGEWSGDGQRVVYLRSFTPDSIEVRSRAWDRSTPDSVYTRTTRHSPGRVAEEGFQAFSLARTSDRMAIRIAKVVPGVRARHDVHIATLGNIAERRPLAIAATPRLSRRRAARPRVPSGR